MKFVGIQYLWHHYTKECVGAGNKAYMKKE